MIKYLKNERGDSMISFTAFFIMSLVILLVQVMIWLSVEINCIMVHNAVKKELTNIAVRISEDSYTAMREGNLNAYYQMLVDDAAYKAELREMIISNINCITPVQTNNYKIDNVELSFIEHMDSIEYVVVCDVEYYVSLLGDMRTIRTDEIRIGGKHNLKTY